MRVAAVVLAAGSSSRLGRAKQEIVFRGETLLERAVRIASEAAGEVIVVVREARHLPGVRVVVNEEAREGIASSIRAGVTAAPPDARLLVVLVDQPLVTAEHLRALVAAGAPIAASGYAGIAGVPAAFSPQFRDELLALRGDRGARAVIEAHRDRVVVVPFDDAAVDVDRAEDLERLR